ALAGATVGGTAETLLLKHDRGACVAADDAVDLADVVATIQQQLLQFATLEPRQPRVVGGPVENETRAAAQSLRQQRDRKRIALGGVVRVDRVEVAEHQERGSIAAGRHHQRRAPAIGRYGTAVHPCDALPYPMRQRLPPGTSVGTAE